MSGETQIRTGPDSLQPILRATAVLGGSSAITIAAGLVSSKAWALLLGADGFGFMGLLVSMLGLMALVTGTGIHVALVRIGAAALGKDDLARFAALERATWLLFWLLAGLAAGIVTLLRNPISRGVLGDSEHGWAVALVGVALLFTVAASVQTNILNAHHRVGALARASIYSSLLGTALSIGIVWRWREGGVPYAVGASAVAGWAVSYAVLKRTLEPARVRPRRQEVRAATSSLLRFAGPFTASALAGSGVQLAIPVLVLHSLDAESVGFYRAAVNISVVYLGFLLSAMGLDYYPRVSAASDRPGELRRLVNQQHQVVMMLGVPMILALLALAPYVVPLVYSSEFRPTVGVVEWQLIGDLLRFSSWTMSYIILVHGGIGLYFMTELVSGVTILVASVLGVTLFGLAGFGMAFAATYAVYYLIAWMLVRRRIGLVWTTTNKALLLGSLLAVLLIRALPLAGLGDLKLPVGVVCASLAGAFSLHLIRRDAGGLRGLLPR